MEKYSEYKDSGVQWLGKVPGHWDCVKLKYLIDIKSGDVVRSESITPESSIPIYGGGEPLGFCNCSNTLESDIIIGRVGARCGCISYPRRQAWATDNALILSSKINVPFTAYLLVAANLNNLNSANAQPLITGSKVKNHKVSIPPLPEQQAIVAFLDGKCGKIDRLLVNKQKELDLLQEMKQRIIADAVTRGLDPSVKMKPSGIPWLPQIPEHWEVRKMKYLFDERSEKNHPDEPMLSATQTEGVILQSKYKNRVVVVNTGFEGLKLVKVGDFVIHLRSFQGGIEIAYDQGIISSAYTVLKPRITEYSPYYKHLFKSSEFIDLLKTCVTGIREGQNINYFKLKQCMLPIPPISEQRAIVSHITSRVKKIDTLALKLLQEIDNIKEYKQRLISDVVTGQIKVC